MKKQRTILDGFKGFSGSKEHNALTILIDSGIEAGINESINLYSKDSLNPETIKRLACQVKILRELKARIDLYCVNADSEEMKEEIKEGDYITWQE